MVTGYTRNSRVFGNHVCLNNAIPKQICIDRDIKLFDIVRTIFNNCKDMIIFAFSVLHLIYMEIYLNI